MQGLFSPGKDWGFNSKCADPVDSSAQEEIGSNMYLRYCHLLFSVLYRLLLESDVFPLFSCLGKHLSTVIHVPGSRDKGNKFYSLHTHDEDRKAGVRHMHSISGMFGDLVSCFLFPSVVGWFFFFWFFRNTVLEEEFWGASRRIQIFE